VALRVQQQVLRLEVTEDDPEVVEVAVGQDQLRDPHLRPGALFSETTSTGVKW
jgi:hypothetical protein